MKVEHAEMVFEWRRRERLERIAMEYAWYMIHGRPFHLICPSEEQADRIYERAHKIASQVTAKLEAA